MRLLSLILLGALSLSAAGAKITGTNSGALGFGSTWTSSSFNSTGGTLIVVAMQWGQQTTTVTVSDNKSNGNATCTDSDTVTGGIQGQFSFSAGMSQICYWISPTVGTGHTVTVTWSANEDARVATVEVFSGATTFDKYDSDAGNDTAPLSGAVTTTATDLLFELITVGTGGTITNTAGFTAGESGGTTLKTGYFPAQTAGSKQSAGTVSPSQAWHSHILAFTETGGGGGGGTTLTRRKPIVQ